MDAERFANGVTTLGIRLSPIQLNQFEQFETALYAANEITNFTRVPRDECWIRHFVDSLLFQDLIPVGSQVLDIGTGPGFPAWPLACARPDLTLTALDANSKMLGFLESQPLPNLKAVKARAEEWSMVDPFDFVTGRALAPLSIQLEVSARLCKLGGRVVPMRTPSDAEILDQIKLEPLGLKLVDTIERPLAGTDIIRLFPIYEKTRATKSGYPRRWAEIKNRPL